MTPAPEHPRARLAPAVSGATSAAFGWIGLTLLGVPDALGVSGLDAIAAAALVGGGIGWVVGTRWLRPAAVGVLAAVVIVSYLPGLGRMLSAITRNDPLPAAPVDAVVALAGSVSADGVLGQHAVDRLVESLQLLRRGAGRRLVVSRVANQVGRDSVDSEADIRYFIVAAGLAIDPVVLGPVGSTRLEAERLREHAAGSGMRRIIVVTSPTHTGRACATFEKLGFVVTCRASPNRAAALSSLPRPTDRLAGFAEWSYEMLAWGWYRLRGYV